MLGKVEETEGKENFVLCLDPEAEHFASGMGDPLFTADGKATDLVQKIFKSLEIYQKELLATQALFKRLDEKELIVDRSFKLMVDKKERRIDGFKGVDIEKLTALDDKSLADMVKNGTIGQVYEHTQSLSNFSKFMANPPRK